MIHGTGTREIDRLGGLLRTMPKTGLYFLIGAAAICGLPPLNGFVSELLIYLGLFDAAVDPSGGRAALVAGAFGVTALAAIGALAVACFVKVFGAVFLGNARSDLPNRAHESPRSMLSAMGVLSAACVIIGVVPLVVAPALSKVARDFAPETAQAAASLTKRVPFAMISVASLVLIVAVALSWAFLKRRLRSGTVGSAGTWDCGYLAPTEKMQYTSSSFAEMLIYILSLALRPKVHRPALKGMFPARASFESHVPDVVLDGVVLPSANRLAAAFGWFRWIQAGSINMYLVYVVLVLIVLLVLRP